MRTWNLTPDHSMNLTIAADEALGPVDPLDDQVWEVTFEAREPRAFAIHTCYGMRAVEARYFPVFMRKNQVVIDPRDFHTPPVAHQMLPSYLDFTFSPLEGVEVRMEYWVSGSKILTGRITIINQDPAAGKLDVDWVGQITPLGEGAAMLPETIHLNTVLAGRCGGLEPVCFISGGCGLGNYVYPALSLQLHPRSTQPQVFTWASAATTEKSLSYHTARNNAFRSWEAEISRVESANDARLVEVHTGREDWDAILHASQTTGYRLVMSGSGESKSSFTTRRNLQTGFPPRTRAGWPATLENNQTAWQNLYISRLLLPGGADLVRGFLENLLSRQQPDGSIEWGENSSRLNAQPVVAQLALELLPYLGDVEWLREILPKLEGFYLSWFLPQNDRDGDGFPEWRASGHSGWLWEQTPWIGYLEPPGLAVVLLKEADAIQKICEMLGEPFPEDIAAHSGRLAGHLAACWDEEEKLFRYRDFESHVSEKGEILLETSTPGSFQVKKKFASPRHIWMWLGTESGLRQPLNIKLYGRFGGKPSVMEVKSREFSITGGFLSAIARESFSQVDRIYVRGLETGNRLHIETCDSSRLDFTLVLPVVTKEIAHERFTDLVDRTIPKNFLLRRILSPYPASLKDAPLEFIAYLVQGLIEKGARSLAVRILGGWLDEFSDPIRFLGDPCLDSFQNTVPITTFLKLCGVEAITSREVILNGFNPFPGIVRVRFRDTILMLHADKSVVLLNDRDPIEITSPDWVRIPLGHTGKRS